MPASADQDLGVLSASLRRIIHALDSHSRRQARSCGLTSPQALALASLAAAPDPQSIGELASSMSLSQATTTSLAQRLEARGLIQRLRSPIDRRKTQLHLTAAGLDALATEASVLPPQFQRHFKALPTTERERLTGSLLELAQLLTPDATPTPETTTPCADSTEKSDSTGAAPILRPTAESTPP